MNSETITTPTKQDVPLAVRLKRGERARVLQVCATAGVAVNHVAAAAIMRAVDRLSRKTTASVR